MCLKYGMILFLGGFCPGDGIIGLKYRIEFL